MAKEGLSVESRPPVREDEELWVGVLPQFVKSNPDGTHRPSSATFKSRTRHISVFLASKTTPQECMSRNPTWVGLAAIHVALPRELGYEVVEDPLPGNPAHAEILGPITKKAHAKRMAREAKWIVEPH
ncbi:MAG: hypothetical protein JW889_11125 [Verrucomicrobia bacterium]|nr:hypothetical protein [Verrucomicrobiota bacterium]